MKVAEEAVRSPAAVLAPADLLARGERLLVVAVVFLSAFLLFQVQPLIARFILPWFGGSPAVWTTCMLFFQAALLLGYAYASRIVLGVTPRTQRGIHLALLGLSLLSLPITPDPAWKPGENAEPVSRILGLLTVSIGVPFFVLAATSPLLQAWLAARRDDRSAYRLYAVSNLGSLLALLSYPIVFEPFFTIRLQARMWSLGFSFFVFACIALTLRLPAPSAAVAHHLTALPLGTRALWVGLAAAASTLLLAVTNELTLNVAAIPFLWVLPLALYLVSFILCFASDRSYHRALWVRGTAIAVVAITWAMASEAGPGLAAGILLHSAALFACCMLCHGELVRLRPAAGHLTSFYLMMALGGAIGGVFVGIAAPLVFSDTFELPIGLAGAVLFAFAAAARDPTSPLHAVSAPRRRLAFAILAAAIGGALLLQTNRESQSSRVAVRNFYGTLKVRDEAAAHGVPAKRLLVHGATAHGLQLRDAARGSDPAGYYGRDTGVGLLLRHWPTSRPRRVGLIGLGAGTLAAYGASGDTFRFYEINPLVVDLARTEFTFLAESPARVEVIVADARLALEREEPQAFDLFIADAFSSDAVPTHLLTLEAFELYLRHLRPGGAIAVHVSNRYLDLAPVVAAAAASLGKDAFRIETPADPAAGVFAAEWVVVAEEESLARVPALARIGKPLDGRAAAWTDDYSNLFGSLR